MSFKKLYNLYISGASSALKKSYFYLLPVNTTRTCLVYHHPYLPPFTTESFRYVRRYIVSLKKVSFYILWTPQRCRSVYHRPRKSLFLRPVDTTDFSSDSSPSCSPPLTTELLTLLLNIAPKITSSKIYVLFIEQSD